MGRLCPDFVNVNGQKKIIEVFGEAYHDPKVSASPVPFNRTEKGRKQIFRKYGYDTLVIWTKEIVPNNLVRLQKRIRKFHENCSN